MGLPILFLGKEGFELLKENKRGHKEWLQRSFQSRETEAMLVEIKQAVKEIGLSGKPILLALGEAWLQHSLLEIPELAKGAQRQVLHRKACKLIDAENRDTLFASILFRKANQHEEMRRRLLVVLKRGEINHLLQRFRAHRIPIKKLTVANLQRLSFAGGLAHGNEEAQIVVEVDSEQTVVTLVANGSIVQRNVLGGGLDESEVRALSLAQEIRGLDFFWRKNSRGGTVQQIVLFGLGHANFESLRGAVARVLESVEVIDGGSRAAGHVGEGNQEDQPRYGALRACACFGEMSLDLSPLLPAGYLPLLALSAVLLGFTGFGLLKFHQKISDRMKSLRSETAALLGESSDLERLRQEQTQALVQLKNFETEVQRVAQAGAVGIDLEHCLQEAIAAHTDDAAILGIEIKPAESGGVRMHINGLTHAHPLKAVEALRRVQHRLESSPAFKQVAVEPQAGSAREGAGRYAPYSASAQLEGYQ
ncbi:MAG: hypothetical protein DWQ01_17095 [Planctomycetota bacterium]|nr:MAG: hypothetical protein DWQ01_17095 [Planctomycetota bacterium]